MRQPGESRITESGEDYFDEEGMASGTKCCSRSRKLTTEIIQKSLTLKERERNVNSYEASCDPRKYV